MSEPTQTDARRIAEEARERVRFEEEALDLSDQVFRVARHLVGSRDEAEDLMQETYARAFRSWRSFTPGTNLRAWLLRILTNLNIDRGRRQQRAPQTTSIDEHPDYYLYNKIEEAEGRPLDEERVIEKLSRDRSWMRSRTCRTTFATCSCSSTSASSATRTPRRSSTSRSAPS